MSHVECACAEKMCLSHIYNTSVCNQCMSSSYIQIKSVVLIVAILSLNSTFD